MPEDRLKYLLEKYHTGTCTPEELEELENWYNDLHLTDEHFAQEDAEQLKEEMLLQFRDQLAAQDKKVVKMPRRRWRWRIAAAAAILLLISAGVFYLAGNSDKKEDAIVKKTTPENAQEILPGGNHATLTMADGSSILLDTAKLGGLAQQGISAIHKPVDGLLVYRSLRSARDDGSDDGATGMNTIRTPRGGQYQVKLPDGTNVWLNAASSIQFPVNFTGDKRSVAITGEVYFEVAPHVTASGAKQSFIVDVANKGEVEVLGTHFNINAYDDEVFVKTTLLEGSVRVRTAGQSKMLKPGQQAQITNNNLSILDQADVEEAVAWKNGLFKFNDADIQSILRQAARWYDIEVEIRGTANDERFRGKISRDVKLSEFLRILEVNQVPFQIEGKKIIIQH